MRIDPNQFLGNAQADNVQPAKTGGTQPSQSGAASSNGEVDAQDTFQLSGTLGQVQQLKNQLAQMADARSERVAALRQQVQQGTYRPSNEQIANAMVSEAGSNKRS
jgi:flagellar biosynthesis anti-sigma factor FlgM